MSMRDIHFGIQLNFDTPEEQEISEDFLVRILGLFCRLNKQYLIKNPDTPLLYDSKVVYTKPDQVDDRPPMTREQVLELLALLRRSGRDPETALMILRLAKGVEIFLDIPALYRRGKGDCNELAPVRVAELWRAGVPASPWLLKQRKEDGGWAYHACVWHPDESAEDPSIILGMGGPERRDERQEEIRKNVERYAMQLQAGKYLCAVEGVPIEEVAKKIDSMGLVPRSGTFLSPYRQETAVGGNFDPAWIQSAA